MQQFIKSLYLCFSVAISVHAAAQTGPGPAAEKNAIGSEERVVPRSVFDGAAAAKIWNITPRDNETTRAMERRVERMLRDMIANSEQLDYDTSYWRLLAFLREVPWNKLTPYRKNWYLRHMPNPRLTDEQREWQIERLKKKPIYRMNPKEVDVYLGFIHEDEPDFRKRVVRLARQNLGQPYDIYLLGEFPHEVYDPDPMFCLEKGDCVVFSEHMYAMALGRNWKEFYAWLQQLRYKDGEPGMTTRNHFTEADWNVNNGWLLTDVTTELGATTVTAFTAKIDRARFFRNFGIGQDIPVQTLNDNYIASESIEEVLPKLQEGDFINIVRGVGAGVWVGHVGLVSRSADGTVNIIHSTEPRSIEEPIMEYVKRNERLNRGRRERGRAEFKGMKFLRLRAEEMEKMLAEGKGPRDLPKDAVVDSKGETVPVAVADDLTTAPAGE